MKVVVSGCAGFIGSHLTRTLLAQGHEVVGIDLFVPNYDPSLKWAALAPALITPRFRLVEGDIRDANLLSQVITSDVDQVVHLAALAGVRASIDQPAEYIDVNVRGSVQILEACRKSGVGRLVLASSSSVYGAGAPTPFREDLPPGLPLSPYAASKRSMEVMSQTWHQLYGLSIVNLRFFTVYGPGQRPDLAIHKFTHLIHQGRPLPFFGDGSSQRDYTHVADIVRGIGAAMDWVGQGHRWGVFNLAGGQTISLRDLVILLEHALGKKAMLQQLPNQSGDMDLTWADLSLAKEHLKVSATIPFEEGIRDFVAWYLQQGINAPRLI